MINRFLNNVNNGKNDWWRYLISIILTWIVSNFIGVFVLGFLVAVYFISIGTFDVNAMMDLINSYDYNIVFFFIMIFITISFSLIFLFISLKFIHKRDFMSIVNFSGKYDEFSGKTISWIKRIRWKLMLKGALIWLAFILVPFTIGVILEPENLIINFNIENLYLIIALFLLAIPIQVLFEELFFRGYLNQGLSLLTKKPLPIILASSIVFSIGHIFNGGADPVFMATNVIMTLFVGIILSVATLVTNGIEWAVGAHFANNFFAFLISSSEGSIGTFETIVQTKTPTDPLLDLIFSTIFFVIFMVILFFYKKDKILKVFA